MPSYTTGSLEKVIAILEDDVASHIEKVVRTLHSELMAATPVYSGEAVSAWVASTAPTTTRPQHSTAGDPGPTSGMPLGAEPRRAANEAIARQSLSSIDFTQPLSVAYVQNASPHIIALEYGELPSEERSRTPALGIVETAIAATVQKIK